MNKRIFVEKKADFQVKSESLVRELQHNLGLSTLKTIRIVQVYDVFDLAEDLFARAEKHIFSEQVTDTVLDEARFRLILRSMLSLLLKACRDSLTNVQHLRRKLCFCLVVQMM